MLDPAALVGAMLDRFNRQEIEPLRPVRPIRPIQAVRPIQPPCFDWFDRVKLGKSPALPPEHSLYFGMLTASPAAWLPVWLPGSLAAAGQLPACVPWIVSRILRRVT